MQIGDAPALGAIDLFMSEARTCATYRKQDGANVLGIAAISTAFSCVLAVGEALLRRRGQDRDLITAFCQEMGDKRSWLFPPEGRAMDDADVPGVLTSLRNGLAHALSVPPDIVLLRDRGCVQPPRPECWQLVVCNFVDAVEATARHVARQQPDLLWDPKPPAPRSSATMGFWSTTGSEPGVWTDEY